MIDFDELALLSALKQNKLELSADQLGCFKKYVSLLLLWNKRTNLISRGDEPHIIDRHVLESLSVLLVCEIPVGSRLVDIGSGAGFPAIPIKLMRPDLEVVLVESKRFKTLFLREVIQRLSLASVRVVCERVELLGGKDEFCGRFDFAFCRAVASLVVEYDWARPMLTLNGKFIAWKGGDVQGEIHQLLSQYHDIAVDVVMMNQRIVDPARNKKLIIVQRNA
ncbi:MAG: 16S rRNA (guanine(527)-N(7))-methyltransferase RsmG [candidate division KSB1 bacterium]|nr:16S rRNA (guanine(527)-N(7))-methyltransferase RsmG [candidate division KSB1 bacterium]MDZ7318598.1 16S rRNA (guanine(527)-N(7))-methyltransferase RsmG [candidate division KSB1 bacterium]MDZ7340963.1 16S rRNA (guanine(527)-N(7))-methyltransferase RsmG [candidate division KSB1 bacterium]